MEIWLEPPGATTGGALRLVEVELDSEPDTVPLPRILMVFAPLPMARRALPKIWKASVPLPAATVALPRP